jgi:prepilin-type N-terminal cleavage/methylation domain-containing protein
MNSLRSIIQRTFGNRETSRGYNLVEVIIAMALLGTVMLSIFTLFFMGRGNVYSGKQMTQAIAIGNHVLEDLSPLNKQAVYNGCFAITDTASGSSITIPTPTPITYANSKIRSTDPSVIASAPSDISTEATGGPAFLSQWGALVGNKLTKGSVTLILTPDQDAANSPDQFKAAAFLRVRVLVRWQETGRQRQLVLDTVKSY